MRALHSFEDAFYELAMTRPLQADVQLMCQKQDEEARLARLAENVGNHIAASLEVAVGRAMAPLTQSLDTFIKCATREQVDGVRRIVGQFVQQLNASLNGQMTALGDTMTAVTKGQIQAQQNLKNALETSRSLAESAKSIQDSSAQVARTMKELSDALNAQRIEQNVGVDAARTAAENIAARLEALGESLGRMQSALDRLSLDLDEQPAAASQDGEPTAMAL